MNAVPQLHVPPAASPFERVELAPRDPILGMTEAFNADTRPGKINLGVGFTPTRTEKFRC